MFRWEKSQTISVIKQERKGKEQMINTYAIDNEVWKTTGSVDNLKDMKRAYEHMGKLTSMLYAENQALENAIKQYLSEDVIEMLMQSVNTDLLENYYWRNTPEEDRKKLSEYGYKMPVVLLEHLNMAYSIFDEGLPVFLLHKDGTETLATKGSDIERHMKSGGLVGTTQFAREKEEELYLHGDEEK